MTTTVLAGEERLARRFVRERAWTLVLRGSAAAAGAVTLLGIFVAPERTWPGVLLSAAYLIGLSLAGMLFLAFHYVTSAGWSVCLKRIAEALSSTLPLAAGAVVLSLGGMGVLYEWARDGAAHAHPLLEKKAAWLEPVFFAARAAVFLGAWWLFCHAMLRISRRQDGTGGLAANRRSTVLSALFIAVFAVTFSLASFDWLMSLQPEWYSTIFAGYNFAGSYVSGLAVITICAILLRRQGVLDGVVTEHHLHDLGKLILGFSTFWIYLWFSQYMLIWYGNLPEEVTYYVWRHQGAWAVLAVANLIINWMIPFLVLLPRPAKHDESRLLRICVLLVIGRWLDLYVMIQPVFQKEAPVLGAWEIAPLAAAVALFVVSLRRGLSAASLVPTGDPYLSESLRHHQ